jgi:putative glutamine amidotransferase
MKPLIGVTTSELRPGELATLRRHGEPPHAEMALGITYARAIEAAGGVPVVMPPLSPAGIPALLSRLDGLLLSGGPDLAPGAYDQHPHLELGSTEPRLDAFEYAVVHEALALGLPMLGICRGAQAINIACGGTLHQHLPDLPAVTAVHRQCEDGGTATHTVDVLAGSRLSRIVRSSHVAVNSFHHQAVDRLGEGLIVSARAPDGTVEAIEDSAHRFMVGVQWHAEMLLDNPAHRALFEALVAAASGVAQLPVAAKLAA